jgi:hypothetical protein
MNGRTPVLYCAARYRSRGDHDQADHPEDQPGRAEVRAEEPRVAVPAVGRVPDPDDGERGQRGEDGDGEEVLEEADHRPAAR